MIDTQSAKNHWKLLFLLHTSKYLKVSWQPIVFYNQSIHNTILTIPTMISKHFNA
ncbi:hypothetical protein K450DRAFT_263967 [Umbelopsis ramanniana AG]|uniref:Uncharacterized protein n=1 Tax=Umbelopsis ramanniana AG TaxID=1314678 RepID=A0AAD5H9H4_UMBRA|nr:uncharacterized protein K450DRAFT_263967 [Umbelopsis ramanniana AG]KAI8574964.1 hypothetical protein K450DRAFT_263967 [Umbelopsis ramanniana AG]